MINTSRIVPIESVDLLTMYGTIMKLAGTSFAVEQAVNPGVFALSSGSGNILAAEPVESFDFGASVSSATVYFVAAYNYKGFSIAGTAATPSGAEVIPDGKTLYTATLSGGSITIAKVGL